MESKLYKHLKSGKIYIYIGNACDQTNNEGYGSYCIYKDPGSGNIYIRRSGEFCEKFKPIEDGK